MNKIILGVFDDAQDVGNAVTRLRSLNPADVSVMGLERTSQEAMEAFEDEQQHYTEIDQPYTGAITSSILTDVNGLSSYRLSTLGNVILSGILNYLLPVASTFSNTTQPGLINALKESGFSDIDSENINDLVSRGQILVFVQPKNKADIPTIEQRLSEVGALQVSTIKNELFADYL
jgi:hypothetical protein